MNVWADGLKPIAAPKTVNSMISGQKIKSANGQWLKE